MSRYENKTHKDIAAQLGITVKGVEYHISSALKKLYVNLKDYLQYCFSGRDGGGTILIMNYYTDGWQTIA